MHFRHCPRCKLLAMSGEYCAGCGAHLHGPVVTGFTSKHAFVFASIVLAGFLLGFTLSMLGVFQEPTQLSLAITPAVTACTGTVSYTATLTSRGEPQQGIEIALIAPNRVIETLRTDANGRVTSTVSFDAAWCGKKTLLTATTEQTTRQSGSTATAELHERVPVLINVQSPSSTTANTPTAITVKAFDGYDGTAVRGAIVRLQAGTSEKYATTTADGEATFTLTTAQTQTLTATLLGDERYERITSPQTTITVTQPTLTSRVAGLQETVVAIRTPTSVGSGVIIETTQTHTTILTNRHVIEGATTSTILVTTNTNENVFATTVRLAPEDLDLALITTTPLGTAAHISETLPDRGEPVVAIGNPLGLAGSVSRGIVSNTINTQTGAGVSYTVIQTDAAVNPGNSGGGLFTEDTGALVGIVSAKRFDAEGIGFAIAINALELFEN